MLKLIKKNDTPVCFLSNFYSEIKDYKMSNNINRRKWLQLGLGLTAGAIGSGFTISKISNTEDNCKLTPILELGPYATMKYRNQPDHDIDLTSIKGKKGIAKGKQLMVSGIITDENCNPLQGAIVELWQANHFGKYHHEFDNKGEEDPDFQGWGQAITNKKGEYNFKTVVPGLYGNRARHIHFKISKRGYHELTTQLYFDGEERNKTDGILNNFTHEEQLAITRPVVSSNEINRIEFNMVLDKVKKGVVSEKVLKEYIGKYELQNEGTGFEEYVKNITGLEYKNIELGLHHEGVQLYMTLPFSPKTEIGWASKDEFQSWSFYNTFIRFQRNAAGKVVSLHLHLSEDQFIKGIRK